MSIKRLKEMSEFAPIIQEIKTNGNELITGTFQKILQRSNGFLPVIVEADDSGEQVKIYINTSKPSDIEYLKSKLWEDCIFSCYKEGNKLIADKVLFGQSPNKSVYH